MPDRPAERAGPGALDGGAAAGRPRSLVVATHGHCFDGLCAAVVFTRLARRVHGDPLEVQYRGCTYGPRQEGVDPRVLRGGENAVLDFRYVASDRVTWYFDHHATAFATPEDAAHFETARAQGRRVFWDPSYGSCTKLVADVARERFGMDGTPDTDDLVLWAERIDAARFATVEEATSRDTPALRLMAVVEHHGDDRMLARLAGALLERPLEEVARSEAVRTRWERLDGLREAFVARVRRGGARMGSVAYVDLCDEPTDVVPKFVTYALYPDAAYAVVVSRGNRRCKIAVGYNPWSGAERRHDIAAICRRWGGGGHAVVGAVALPAGDVARAREVARAIAKELDT